jgi:hypothetical protein
MTNVGEIVIHRDTGLQEFILPPTRDIVQFILKQ